jgi:hypothetical protein
VQKIKDFFLPTHLNSAIMVSNGTKGSDEVSICELPDCDLISNQRCSSCKKVYYCSVKHQRLHWTLHKINCCSSSSVVSATKSANICSSSSSSSSSSGGGSKSISTSSSNEFDNTSSKSSSIDNDETTGPSPSAKESSQEKSSYDLEPKSDTESGKRCSRCMFCGEQLVLSSEDDAVNHMKECPALQEQLESKDQFTIPTMLQKENNINIP